MWLPPSPGRDEFCEYVFAHGSYVHQKCSNYALTNLFRLCMFVWIINPLVTHPSPIPKLQHAPLPFKCYKSGSVPQLLIISLFSPLHLQLSLSRSLGVCHWTNDMGLHQNGGVQYATIKYHNKFATNMSRAQRVTSSYLYIIWKRTTNFDYPNLGLERSIWDNQGTIE